LFKFVEVVVYYKFLLDVNEINLDHLDYLLANFLVDAFSVPGGGQNHVQDDINGFKFL